MRAGKIYEWCGPWELITRILSGFYNLFWTNLPSLLHIHKFLDYIHRITILLCRLKNNLSLPSILEFKEHTSHRFSLINFETESSLKCNTALGFDFTVLRHLCFSVALYIYILAFVVSFGFLKVIGKILIDFYLRACNL